MSQLAASIFLIFLLKNTCVVLLAISLRAKFKTFLESVLASWCFVQTVIYGQMLILAAFSLLTTYYIWLSTLGLLGIICVITTIIHNNHKSVIFKRIDVAEFITKQSLIPLAGIIIVFVYYCWHSLYFYDTSADALSYGLTRIQLYAHYHTLFINQPTISFNIFSNEWNGELSALYYVLATDNLQAATFANAEIWLLLSLSFCYFAEIFKVPARFRVLFGFAFASAPVFLGLAMLVKGDLLSIAAFLLGGCYILRMYSDRYNAFCFFAAMTAFSISGGAKLTTIVSVGLFIFFAFYKFILSSRLNIHRKISFSLLVILFVMINNSRYVANLFVYKNTFKHVEPAHFNIGNVFKNFVHIIINTADLLYATIPFPAFFFVISPGFLWLLPMILSSFAITCFFIFKRKSFEPLQLVIFRKLTIMQMIFLASAFFIGLIVLMSSQSWYITSYRYFVSWIVFLLAILTVTSSKYWRKINSTLIFSGWIFFSSWNYFTAFTPMGEQLSVPYYAAIPKNGQQRLMVNIPHYSEQIGMFADSVPRDAKILVLNGLGKIVSPFFGSNYRNNIYLIGTPDGPHAGLDFSLAMLISAVKEQSNTYDYIVLTGVDNFTDEIHQSLKIKLDLFGYKETLINKDIAAQYVYIFKKMGDKHDSASV